MIILSILGFFEACGARNEASRYGRLVGEPNKGVRTSELMLVEGSRPPLPPLDLQ